MSLPDYRGASRRLDGKGIDDEEQAGDIRSRNYAIFAARTRARTGDDCRGFGFITKVVYYSRLPWQPGNRAVSSLVNPHPLSLTRDWPVLRVFRRI
jgi:hypothetical protein